MTADNAKWTKRLFWLVLILGVALIGVNVAFGVQEIDVRRKLTLEQQWMKSRLDVEILLDKRLKQLEKKNANANPIPK